MAEDKNNPETLPLEQEDKKKLLSQRSQPAYDDNDEEDFDSDDKKYGEKYVKKLRNENIKWKQRAAENKEALDRAKEAEEKAQKTYQEISEIRQIADKRLITAEIKAVAVEMGLKNIRYAALADMEKVKVLDSGEVQGVREALDALKTSDPDLFKMATSTNKYLTSESTNDTVSKRISLKNLSEKEYQERRRDFVRSSHR